MSISGVWNIAQKNNLQFESRNPKEWSQEEIDILYQYYPVEGAEIIKRLPNRPLSGIVSKCSQLKIKKPRETKKVLCIELNKIFESIGSASKEMNIDKKGISKCCRGETGYKTAGGYHWQWVE
jgi:hypothetical protein